MAAVKQVPVKRSKATGASGQAAAKSRQAVSAKRTALVTGGARLQPFVRAEQIREALGLSQQEYATFLGIDPRTYSRRGEEEHLKSGESLQVEMIVKVLEEAVRVFRDEELARNWLRSPIVSLGNMRPIDHLNSIEGYERVKDTLGKIEYGMY